MLTKRQTGIVYRTWSVYILYKSIFITFICVSISAYCFYHFNENPVVTTIAGLLFMIPCLLAGDTEFILYEDRLEYVSNSLLSFFLKYGRKKIFYLEDIDSYKASGTFRFKSDVLSDLIITSVPFIAHDSPNQIDIRMKDGSSVHYSKYIYLDKLLSLENLIMAKLQENTTAANTCLLP